MKAFWELSCIFIIAGSAFAVWVVQSGHDTHIIPREGVLPSRPTALVLGASLRRGNPSPALAERLDTAVEVYKKGSVKKLIVSGDNRTADYNEPESMKKYLIGQGIPASDIIADYAGRRTYDSCYRLKEIFDQDSVLIITQRFHLGRALYLCKKLGVDAIGVSADASWSPSLVGAYVREVFASIKAWLDVVVLKPTPILGEKEKVF